MDLKGAVRQYQKELEKNHRRPAALLKRFDARVARLHAKLSRRRQGNR